MTKVASKINGSVANEFQLDFRSHLMQVMNDLASLRPQSLDPSILIIYNKINFVWNFAIKKLQEFNLTHYIKNVQIEALTAALHILKDNIEALKNQIGASLMPSTSAQHSNQSLILSFEELTWGIISVWFDNLIKPLIALQQADSISEFTEEMAVSEPELQVDSHIVQHEAPKINSHLVEQINEWHCSHDLARSPARIPLSFFASEGSYQALLECIPLFEPRQVLSILRSLCLNPKIENDITQKIKYELISSLAKRCSQEQRNELISALIVNSQTSNTEMKTNAYINLLPLSDYHTKEQLNTIVENLLKDGFSDDHRLRLAAQDLLIHLTEKYKKEHFSKIITELERKSHSRELYIRDSAQNLMLAFASHYGWDQINKLMSECLSESSNYFENFFSSFLSKCSENHKDAIIRKLNLASYSVNVKVRLLACEGFCAVINWSADSQRAQYISRLIEDCQLEDEQSSKKAKNIFINLAKHSDELHVNGMIEIFKENHKSAHSSEREEAIMSLAKLAPSCNRAQQNDIISYLIEEYQNPYSLTRQSPWRALVKIASFCVHTKLEKIAPSLIYNYFCKTEWTIDEADWNSLIDLSSCKPEEFIEYFPSLILLTQLNTGFIQKAAYCILMNIAPYCSGEQIAMLIPVLIAAFQQNDTQVSQLALEALPFILPYCLDDQKQRLTDILMSTCQNEALYELTHKNLSLLISDCTIPEALQLMTSGKNTLLINHPNLNKHILWTICRLAENESKPIPETLMNYLFYFSCLQKLEDVVLYLTSKSTSKVSMAVISLLALPVAASQKCIMDYCQSNPNWDYKMAVSAFQKLSYIPLAENFADLISESMVNNSNLELSLS